MLVTTPQLPPSARSALLPIAMVLVLTAGILTNPTARAQAGPQAEQNMQGVQETPAAPSATADAPTTPATPSVAADVPATPAVPGAAADVPATPAVPDAAAATPPTPAVPSAAADTPPTATPEAAMPQESTSTSSSEPLQVGDQAPDFSLPASDGNTYTLAQFRGVKPVVIAFFPKAFTGG